MPKFYTNKAGILSHESGHESTVVGFSSVCEILARLKEFEGFAQRGLGKAWARLGQMLLHGTSPVNAKQILEQGFDQRLADRGLYGSGTYFTTDMCKALEYCKDLDDKGCHHLVVARVILGHPFMATRPMRTAKRNAAWARLGQGLGKPRARRSSEESSQPQQDNHVQPQQDNRKSSRSRRALLRKDFVFVNYGLPQGLRLREWITPLAQGLRLPSHGPHPP